MSKNILTDEEINDTPFTKMQTDYFGVVVPIEDMNNFARAIESAVVEKMKAKALKILANQPGFGMHIFNDIFEEGK
jgi:hypothetical protein